MQNPTINKQLHLCIFCAPVTRNFFFLISLLATTSSFAQTHSVVVSPVALYTRYGKSAVGYTNAFIPYVSVAAGSYYGELRYNYDYEYTVGVYAGKTYYLNADSSASLIPQVGLLWGNINAGSTQVYYLLNKKRLCIDFENQYSFLSGIDKHIYYNWTSVGYHFSPLFSAGVSAQYYVGPGGNYNDKGVFITFAKADYLFTLYDFNAYDMHRHYVAFELSKDITFGSRKK